MFFPEVNIPIIDGGTLCHIIDASDGDTNYIQFHIDKHDEIIDECTEECREEMYIGDYNLQYDAVKINKFFELTEHSYISNGTFEKLEQESLASGYTMAGSLRHKGDTNFHTDQFHGEFKLIDVKYY